MQRVILVEPEPALREWCRLHLESQRIAVSAFDDVRHALEAARMEPPDLLILAADLPGGGAFAMAATIRSNVRTALIPILFLVPTHDPGAFAHALSIEPQGVVTKPLSRAMLLESVASRVGRATDPSISGGITSTPIRQSLVGGPAPSSGGSGLLLDVRNATVLVVVLRNFVSLARTLNIKPLDTVLRRFMSAARDAVLEQGGWLVRADATGLVVLFEEGPKADRTHPARAISAALGVILAARRARWAEAELRDASVPDLSVGCGVHSGEVIIARMSGTSHLALTIAGQTADLAHRLDGRAKGLGWSIAVSESTALAAGSRFQMGRRASLTDTDHGVTLPISEVLGFNPGTAKPGELPLMAEIREAVLANTILAKLAGDVDSLTADRTIVLGAKRPVETEALPELPQRRVARRIGAGIFVTTYVALHVPTDREEVVKTVRLRELPPRFVDAYLEEYRKVSGLDQRNVVSVYEVGQTSEGGYVALEFLAGGDLTQAVRKKLPVGLALNCLAQMCLALDAVHSAGIIHGALRAEHFLFRQDRVLVLADFNVTERVSDALGLAYPAASGRKRQARAMAPIPGPRVDFQALGRILHAMLTSESPVGTTPADDWRGDKLFDATRLPLPLSPLQPCLDGLLGVGPAQPVECAEDVLVELLAVKEVFPFDFRQVGAEGTSQARELGKR
ncbi:MAG TPA: protein kinase [Burkholderiales bacterium]|nr:protein kinase [Burkholderiales bacterium]